MKPGNSGGGKDPDFWSAFEDGEDRVIGDEPATLEKIRIFQRKLYRKAKADKTLPCDTLAWDPMPMTCDESNRRAGCRKSARPVR
jgi:hypothetical protein